MYRHVFLMNHIVDFDVELAVREFSECNSTWSTERRNLSFDLAEAGSFRPCHFASADSPQCDATRSDETIWIIETISGIWTNHQTTIHRGDISIGSNHRATNRPNQPDYLTVV